MYLNQEKKLILTIGAACALAAGIIGGIIVPTIRFIKQADQDTYNLRLYLEKKYENTQNLRSSFKKVNEIKDIVSSFEQHLYSRGHELQVVTLLEDVADKNRVVQKITNSNLDNPEGNQVEFSITASGNYHDVLRYLNDFEHLPYFITITNLTLTPLSDRNQTDTTMMGAQFQAILYVTP